MSRKNVLRYILLGLLEKREMSGYDIKKFFEKEIGEFWSAKHSQIYPELIKLEEQGLVKYRIDIVGSKLEKKHYSITDKGIEELDKWLGSAEDLIENRDEFVLKLYFIDNKEDDRLNIMVNKQINLHKEKLEHLESRMQIVFDDESKKEVMYGHYLILDHAIRREKSYLSWLNEIGK
ncbi:MAG: PadR family transcriptional regulator [Clostridium sp.]|uniref:PadR family transcriptional regulator n=1 Tax=Clostridium sp. DSM 8431 TaxID=1761781 RepID=UPI0008EDB2BD|nr:PadR family transcriptional regulator [Clostridium sp. DSM 8431]MCR4945173.1 PadR family transcriptional regulator [Clostridium sp.]SFU81136.1 DNA-binding transcriptional regulator, PadR family [Clostridium sp. DSM 8431]